MNGARLFETDRRLRRARVHIGKSGKQWQQNTKNMSSVGAVAASASESSSMMLILITVLVAIAIAYFGIDQFDWNIIILESFAPLTWN
jgi:hypothetical protein